MGRFTFVLLMALLPAVSSAQTCPVVQGFVVSGELPMANGSVAKCSVSRVLGAGRSEDCFWHFTLRSKEARDHFERLHVELQACSSDPLAVEATDVNHPDSFDQITGQVEGVAVSLSLKDKGGLSQTLVVLRRQLP